MYIVTQINDLVQFEELSCTFLLVDSEGVMPDVRLDKIFKITSTLDKRVENQKVIDSLFYENEYLLNSI
jgi:hypothetical protein